MCTLTSWETNLPLSSAHCDILVQVTDNRLILKLNKFGQVPKPVSKKSYEVEVDVL